MLCARDACTNSLYYILMDFVQQAVAQSHDSDFCRRRHCWRRLPRKAFILRRGTPTCSGFSRLAGVIVGVDFLAEPLSSVGARQHAPVFPGLPASLLASTSSQSPRLPSEHANMLRFFPACRRHCWRRLPRRAFVFRRGTPTCSGFSRLAGVIVGVDFLAEPLSSVRSRQHAQVFSGLPETSVGGGK